MLCCSVHGKAHGCFSVTDQQEQQNRTLASIGPEPRCDLVLFSGRRVHTSYKFLLFESLQIIHFFCGLVWLSCIFTWLLGHRVENGLLISIDNSYLKKYSSWEFASDSHLVGHLAVVFFEAAWVSEPWPSCAAPSLPKWCSDVLVSCCQASGFPVIDFCFNQSF